MKSLITMGLAAAIAYSAQAQYTLPSAPEKTYSGLNSATKVWNVGTDTRAEFTGPYGSTSVWFANYLNVTVTDHPSGSAPRFYWNGSHTLSTFGSLALPADAYDPDVVLIENDTRICALIVYYSQANGGYCMSWSRFFYTTSGGSTTTYFEPLSVPMLIEPYNPPNDSLICINIDADNDGNYAIAYQFNNQSYCKTGTLPAGTTPVPTVPGAATLYNDHIQPDVTLQHSNVVPNMKVKVVGLRANRSGYKVAMRTFTGILGPGVASPPYPAYSLNNPRIASPLNNTERFALTLMQNDPGSSIYRILFDAYTGTTATASRTLNTGAAGFPPPIAAYVNRLPALSYVNDIIAVGWHTAYLPGPPSAQTNTFVGLDIQDGSFMPTTPTQYQDICPSPKYNPVSAIAISGRYTLWGKSAAYELMDMASPQPSLKLVWVLLNTGLDHWRPANPDDQAVMPASGGFALYPNPAIDFLNISVPKADMKYSYGVFDLFGKKVLEGTVGNGKTTVNVQQLAGGTYFVRIDGAGNTEENKLRFVKR